MGASGRRARVVALGMWLLWRQPLVVAALAVAAAGGLAAAAFAIDTRSAVAVPTITATALAWSAGVMVAFCGAMGATARDARQGVIALVSMRGVRASSYAMGRVVGLSATIGLGVGGATLLAGLCAISIARPVLPALRSTGGALAYCIAFAATMGPLATAVLGLRSRVAGYLSFSAVLVVPEIAASPTAGILPSGWREVTSIPAALDAVRAGVESPCDYGMHAARALAILVAIAVVSFTFVRARAARAESRWPG